MGEEGGGIDWEGGQEGLWNAVVLFLNWGGAYKGVFTI